MEQDIKNVRLLVLNILKEERITIEEAETIIKLLSKFESLTKDKTNTTYIPNISTETFSDFAKEGISKIERFVTGISNNIEKVAQNIGQKINTKLESAENKKEKFVFSEQEELELENDIESISIENNFGNIKIIGERRESILLEINKIISENTEDKVNEIKGTVKISTLFHDKKLQILLPAFNPLLNIHINLELRIPDSLGVELITSSGNINVENLENNNSELKVKSKSGNIYTKNVNYKLLEVVNTSGDVFIEEVSALINVKTTSGIVSLNGNILNNSRITTISGDITSDVFVHDCLEISSSSGNIDFRQNELKKQEIADNIINISKNYSETESKIIDLVTNSGDIIYKGITHNTFRARSNSGNINADSIVVNNSHVEISTTSGDIDLKVNQESSLDFKCETKSGKILTNLKENEDFFKTDNALKGKINNGDSNLYISTVSGDIKLYKV